MREGVLLSADAYVLNTRSVHVEGDDAHREPPQFVNARRTNAKAASSR